MRVCEECERLKKMDIFQVLTLQCQKVQQHLVGSIVISKEIRFAKKNSSEKMSFAEKLWYILNEFICATMFFKFTFIYKLICLEFDVTPSFFGNCKNAKF